jgi:hypothetical protein
MATSVSTFRAGTGYGSDAVSRTAERRRGCSSKVELEKERTEMQDRTKLLEVILNLSKYHREHEKFYAQSPLQNAIELHEASRVLKTMADRWTHVEAGAPIQGNPYAGCEDLNETATIQDNGILFLEGEGEPPEIARLKRNLANMADDYDQTGEWLARAMESSWKVALALIENPLLAAVLGERHRIIANDWQAANLSSLVSRLIKRSLDILDKVDLAPTAIRADLEGPRFFPDYLYASSELIDRAADVAAESATLVHDNERRWRVFRQQVQQVMDGSTVAGPAPDMTEESKGA